MRPLFGSRVIRTPARILLLVFLGGCQGLQDSSWSPPPLEILAASYIGGVVRSMDSGRNWLPLGSDPRPLQAYRKTLALGEGATVFVGTSGGGLFAVEGPDGAYREMPHEPRCDNIRTLHYSLAERILWIGTWGSGVYWTRAGQEGWRRTSDGLTAYDIHCFAEDSRTGHLYCGTTTGVFARRDDGEWSEVPDLSGLDVRDLLVVAGDTVACAAVGSGAAGPRLFVSRDGGTSWEASDRGLPRSPVFCLAFNESKGEILAGTAEGVFRRGVREERWSRLGRNLSGVRVFSLVSAEGHTFAATARGLFGIAPEARAWVNLGGDLAPSAVTDVLVRARPPGRPAE